MLVVEVVTCKSGGLLDPGRLVLYRLHFLPAFLTQSAHEKPQRGHSWNCLYLHLRHGNLVPGKEVLERGAGHVGHGAGSGNAAYGVRGNE